MNSPIIIRGALAAFIVLIAACASDPADAPFKPGQARTAAEERAAAEKLYRSARQSLDSNDMTSALKNYDKLSQQFPFSDFATQGDLERVYALYRNYLPDQALVAADKFIREHPRHAGAAYAQYLKGLVNSNRDNGLTSYLGLDTTKEDVTNLRNAFDDFSVLVRKYPKSIYVGDARQHMIDLRNRVADHEMHIVRFYVKRGAYVAAAKRAEQVITQYPGAPASLEALQLLQDSYRALHLKTQADDAGRLYVALSKQRTVNDYPNIATVERLPTTIQDAGTAVSDVEDHSWLQQLLSVFGVGGTAAATSLAPSASETASGVQPATADETPPRDPNLTDILRATFGLSPSAPAPKAAAKAAAPGEAKTPDAAKAAPDAAAPPAAPEDDSLTGRLNQFFNRERNTKDLAPGGRARMDTTPLLKDAPAAESASAPQASAPPTKTSEPAQQKKKGNWFTNLFSIFDSSDNSAQPPADPK